MEVQTKSQNQEFIEKTGGRACLAVVANGLGIAMNEEKLQKDYGIVKELADFNSLKEAAKKIELKVKFITINDRVLAKVSFQTILLCG